MNNEQLAMPARNLTYCPTAVRSRFTAHSTLAALHSFSAKERDTETGLSYFGARYYSSDLSIWLSVDPMSDKYPSLSPYVYCADNPVKLVDPNGEEIGDYRSWDGELLGNDGHDDYNVYFVSEKESINTIKKNNESERPTNTKDVAVDWSTNIFQLQEVVSVYDRTVLNGGSREEATVFPKGSRPLFHISYPTGNSDGTIEVLSKGYISIHSHRLDEFECPDGSGATCFQSPFTPSEDYDKILFKNYSYNIIVGNRSLIDPTAYAVLYNSETKKVGNIEINTLRNIVLPK